jgi:predicted permease
MLSLSTASWANDATAAVRSLGKSKGFALAAILLLTLGIALNLTVFGIANSALFQAQPGVRDPKSLALIGRTDNGRGFDNTSWAAFEELRNGARLFEGIAASDPKPFAFGYGPSTVRVMGASVSSNYFAVLGVKALQGRVLDPSLGWTPGKDKHVVLSHRFWMNELGGDAKYVNAEVTVNGQPFTVIGVAEPGFRGHELVRNADMWVATPAIQGGALTSPFYTRADFSALTMVGRLRNGVSRRAGEQELQAIFDGFRRKHAKEIEGQGVVANAYTPLANAEIEDIATKVFAVFGALTGLVLLSVCANLAGLVLARSVARQRETAIRLSLGASRWDVIRQMLAEGFALALPAGALGLLLSFWIGEFYLQGLHVDAFRVDLNLTPTALSYAYLAGLLCFAVLSFTFFPAWQATRLDLETALRAGGAAIGGTRTWMRESLVFVQVFVSVLLLAGAALLGQTLLHLSGVDTRMKPDHLLTLAVEPGQSTATQEKQQQFFVQLRERILAIPGVLEASSMAMPPLAGGGMGLGRIHGGSIEKAKATGSDSNIVGPRFFETVGMPILRGRGIGEQDTAKAQRVAVLNETLARRMFGDADAIGQTLYLTDEAEPVAYTVVGLVADGRYRDLTEKPRTMFYVSSQQVPFGRQHLAIRTQGDPLALVEPVRRAVASLDPNLPVFDVKTMETRVSEAALPWKILSMAAIGSGTIAALIAAVGLVGLIAWNVARRTREIGLKLALGAPAGRLLGEVLLRGLRVSLVALLCGLAVAYAVAPLLGEYLFRVNPRAPGLYLGIALGVAMALGLAAWIPARRSTLISPMEALRHE